MDRIYLIAVLALVAALAAAACSSDTAALTATDDTGDSTSIDNTPEPVISDSPGAFTRIDDMKSLRESPGTVTLQDGRVLVTGGRGRGGGGFWLNRRDPMRLFADRPYLDEAIDKLFGA